MRKVRASSGSPVVKLYPYRAHDNPKTYPYQRITSKSLYKFVSSHIPSFVDVLNVKKDALRFLEKKSHQVKVLLVSQRKKVSLMFKALSKDFHQHLDFALVPASSSSVIKTLVDNGLRIFDDGQLPAVFIHQSAISKTRFIL